MKSGTSAAYLWLACGLLYAQDAERNFTGVWNLNAAASQTRPQPLAPASVLRIQQTAGALEWTGDNGTAARYTTDGSETRFTLVTGATSSSRTKWEGRSLMISSVVSGQRSYSINDRWTLSRDRNTLRIRRQVVTLQGEIESELVYEREGAQVATAPAAVTAAGTAPAAPVTEETRLAPAPVAKKAAEPASELTYTIPEGTKIPLRLINAVSTKTAGEGDRVYLETAFPVVAEGRIVIPPGSAVVGTVTHVVRPGKVKGRGELFLRFDSVSLPNGITREFRSRPDGLDAEAKGTLDREEGKIQSPGSKGDDARKAGRAAAAGAAVGSIAGSVGGRPGMGAGIGAAGGAAAGLAGVLLSRGAETVLARGSIIEMQLDRPLVFPESELNPPGKAR